LTGVSSLSRDGRPGHCRDSEPENIIPGAPIFNALQSSKPVLHHGAVSLRDRYRYIYSIIRSAADNNGAVMTIGEDKLSAGELRFARRAVRRTRLSRAISIAGLVVAVLLAVYYTGNHLQHPEFRLGPPAVIVLLVLLNARQNLRQYRHARTLEKLGFGAQSPAALTGVADYTAGE